MSRRTRRLCVTDVPVPFRPFVTDMACVTDVPVPFRQFRGIQFLPFRSDEIGPVPRNCYPLAAKGTFFYFVLLQVRVRSAAGPAVFVFF